MSARPECRRIAALLERLDGYEHEMAAADIESIAAHLESCAHCGVTEAASEEIADGVRNLDAPIPNEVFFEKTADQIMSAVLAEPAEAPAPTGRRRPVSRRVRTWPRRRMVLAGSVAALAAGVALFVTIGGIDDRSREAVGPVAGVSPAAVPEEIVSVAGIDLDEITSSDDAWLIASYDIFDLEVADEGGTIRVEDMSDDELDALEGVFGSAPSLS